MVRAGRGSAARRRATAGLAVLYELGVALDGVGERARALAVLMEIESDEPNYRDVRERLDVLGRAESERRG